MHVSGTVNQTGESRVVLRIPATFGLDAANQVAEAIAQAPTETEFELDFSDVRVCHALVLARLLAQIAALRRASSTTLSNLNPHQQTLLSAPWSIEGDSGHRLAVSGRAQPMRRSAQAWRLSGGRRQGVPGATVGHPDHLDHPKVN